MKILIYIIILFSLISPFKEISRETEFQDSTLTDALPAVENKAFKVGEKARYLVHYGRINAGYASYEIKNADRKLNDRDLLHIVGIGRSQGMLDLFFHVEDRYETYIDEEGIYPWLFIRDVHEGGYEIKQTYKFYHNKEIVETEKGEQFKVPFGVQDMISSAFYTRTIEMSHLKVGDTLSFMSFLDEELFPIMLKFVGREEIKIRSGKYRCMRFHPVIQSGRVFNTSEDLEIWLSDDENKLPILVKANILVGSVKVEITDYEGLSNPLSKVE